MQTKQKTYYDEQGNLLVRPYRLKDLAAIYDVSPKTMRRWIDSKAAEHGKKTKMYFTIQQVNAIITAIGIPHKVAMVIPMHELKQAV